MAGGEASEAGREIIDTAEALLTRAENCRWDNDDAHALRVQIGHYLSDHPRLSRMQDALSGLPPLLGALKERAVRRRLELKPGPRRQARLQAVESAESALADLLDFVDGLPGEIEGRPHETGAALDSLHMLGWLAAQPSDRRVAESDRMVELVASGRRRVADSRTARISGVFTAAMSEVRVAFAA